MNIDGTKLKEFLDTNRNIKNASVRTEGNPSVQTGAFFDELDETKITKADVIGDGYERVGITEKKDDEPGKWTLGKEMIDQLGEVVNEENFSKYEEWGLAPDKDDPTNILTVSERIEIELATHCKNYRVTGHISREDIEAMYGSDVAKQVESALKKAEQVTEIGKEEKEYLLTNHLEPTIAQVYKASHSTGNAKHQEEPLSEEEWRELRTQVEGILWQTGLPQTDANLENGRFLIEHKIPVTGANLYQLSKIDGINEQLQNGLDTDALTRNMLEHAGIGMNVEETSMDAYQSVLGDAVITSEIIANGSKEDVRSLVLDGKDVTLLNMQHTIEERQEAYSQRTEELEEKFYKKNAQEQKNIQQETEKNYQYLQELRLKLSVESSAVMIKNGIQIYTTSLQELTYEVRHMEEVQFNDMVVANGIPTDAGSLLNLENYQDVRKAMDDMQYIPTYILGNVAANMLAFTVSEMTDVGGTMARRLQNANVRYETMRTKADAGMGDSIQKAFEQMDSLLEEMNIEQTEENLRAVRILSFNEMELSEGNLEQIKEMDAQVQRMMELMTPKTTMYLLNHGINPLQTEISKLNEELERIHEKLGEDDTLKYSEYLWKLEKNHEISNEDREAYIGIYRLLHMIEKGQYKSLGAVEKQGLDLTLKNLLTVSKSLKHTGKEVTVSDDTGLTEQITQGENNILEQLQLLESSVYLKRAVWHLSPSVVKESYEGDQQDITELVERMSWQQESAEEQQQVIELKIDELQEMQRSSEEAIARVLEDYQTPNMENLMGVSYFLMNGMNTFSRIASLADDEQVDNDIEHLQKELEEDGDIQSLAKKSLQFTLDVKDALLHKNSIDVRELRRVTKLCNYMERNVANESYYVPFEMDGEEIAVRLTLVPESGTYGKVMVTFGEKDKKVQGEFTLKESKVDAFITAGSEVKELIQKKEEAFRKELEERQLQLGFYYVGDEGSVGRESYAEGSKNREDGQKLLRLSKAFLACIKN